MFLNMTRLLLIPFSFVYLLLVSIRNLLYRFRIFREHKLNAKVISVGNITWGGTGKTPAVLLIKDALLKRGLRPAILIRGYGKDEPELLSRLAGRAPVIVGKNRVKSGREALAKYSADTILLDDGFQHRRLKRDLDIVCIDATNPFGNGLLIPAGSKRERLSALKRADIFLITKADIVRDPKTLNKLEQKLKKLNPDALIVKSIHKAEDFYKLSNEQLVDIEALKGKKIALLSAIGNPRAFEKTILSLGLDFERHFIFRDHHWYKVRELKRIEEYCVKKGIDAIITTEKDAVRLRKTEDGIRNTKTIVLRVNLKIIENEQKFYDRLFGIYNS